MDYNYTVLFVLSLFAAIIIVASFIRKSYVLSNQMELAKRARRRKLKNLEAEQNLNARKSIFSRKQIGQRPVVARELKQVSTPWGWPRHLNLNTYSSTDGEFSHSLRHFAGQLINPKKTKEDHDYQVRRTSSIRALVEDRYGRASRMTEVPYHKVKAPLLRDPNEQFDQLDDLPSSKADSVVKKLSRQKSPSNSRKIPEENFPAHSNLENLKTPWGW